MNDLTKEPRKAIPPNETPSPTAPDDPTRTREAIECRTNALLTRDYGGDEETRDYCHWLARWARSSFWGDSHTAYLLGLAEHLAGLSAQVGGQRRREGKVAILRAELDRKVT
jgi:hypothetical protein